MKKDQSMECALILHEDLKTNVLKIADELNKLDDPVIAKTIADLTDKNIAIVIDIIHLLN